MIVGRPGLRLLQEKGVDQNRDDLEKKCQAEAGRYLSSGEPAQRHLWAGFARLNLSGRINEIRIGQSPPTTTAEVMSWWLPRGNYYRLNKEATGEGGKGGGGSGVGGGPAASTASGGPIAADRVNQGIAGGEQHLTPVLAPLPRQAWPTVELVKIVGVETGGGYYKAKVMKGGPKVDVSTDLLLKGVERASGDDPGMYEGDDCLVVNFDEAVGGGPSQARRAHELWLGSSSVPAYLPGLVIGATDEDQPRTTVAVRAPHAMTVFVVYLTSDGGANGTKTTAPTFTYTCKTSAGDVLAKAKAPEFRQSIGKVTAATRGLGYYSTERQFALLLAFEAPGRGGC